MKSNTEVPANETPIMPVASTIRPRGRRARGSPAAPLRRGKPVVEAPRSPGYLYPGEDPADWKGWAPPPSDFRCECCGKDAREVGPLYNGAILECNLRSVGEPKTADLALYEQVFTDCPDDEVEIKYRWEQLRHTHGARRVNEIRLALRIKDASESSWECRTCSRLQETEDSFFHKSYFQVRKERLSASQRRYLEYAAHPWGLTAQEEDMVTRALGNTWSNHSAAFSYGWLKGWERIAWFHGLKSREELQWYMDKAAVIAVELPNGRLYSNTEWEPVLPKGLHPWPHRTPTPPCVPYVSDDNFDWETVRGGWIPAGGLVYSLDWFEE